MSTNVVYKCIKEMTTYDKKTKEQVDVTNGSQWKQTGIESAIAFQELSCDGLVIELPDELVERHFKTVVGNER
jgi:hypothetical protein